VTNKNYFAGGSDLVTLGLAALVEVFAVLSASCTKCGLLNRAMVVTYVSPWR